MNNEIKEYQVYLVTKGFESKNYKMYSGNIITFHKGANSFTYSVPVEGYVFNPGLKEDLTEDTDFKEILLENSILVRDNIFDDVMENDIIQVIKGDQKLFLSNFTENGNYKTYLDHLLKETSTENFGPFEIGNPKIDNDVLGFLRLPYLDEASDGDVLVEVFGNLENRGHVAQILDGKIEVIVDRKTKRTVYTPVTKELLKKYIKVEESHGLRGFKFKFKTKEEKPSMLLFSKQDWYETKPKKD